MPTTTPRNHLIRIAATTVLPAFAILGVAMTHTSTEASPSVTANPVAASDPATQATAPALVQQGNSPISTEDDSTHSSPVSTPDGSAPASPVSSAPVAPASGPQVSSSPVSTSPVPVSTSATTRPEAKTPASRTAASQVPAHRVETSRVGSQGSDDVPMVKGPRRPGRAPLIQSKPTTQAPAPTTQAPAPTTQTPAPTTQTPVTAPAPVTQPAPTSQAPAPTTQAPAPTTQAPAPTTQAPTTQAPAPTTQAPASSALSNVENLLFNKINAYRVANGVAPLKRNAAMDTMSRNWSTTMATTGTFAHNPDMQTQTPSGWTRIGENVAYCAGYGTDDEKVAQTLFMLWVNSPGHNANMLDPRYNTGSMGIAKVGTGTFYATQNFATF